MPEISLTDFIDFVIKAGSPKLTKVRELLKRGPYNPANDFWKPMREAIQQHHASATDLSGVLNGLNAKKVARYKSALAGYKKFLSKKATAYFPPPYAKWQSGDVVVRVNPELGLQIDGKNFVIKLYFKNDEPTPHRLNAVLQLMEVALRKKVGNDVTFAVLDVSLGKLHKCGKVDPDFAVLLISEATSFAQMWTAMGGKKALAKVAAT